MKVGNITFHVIKAVNSERSASYLEAVCIATTLFVLPLFEAPKNILAVLFLVVWVVQSFKTKSMGVNCTVNWPILGLAAVLWISPLFSAYGNTITPLNSAPRWTLLALFAMAASRLNYSRDQLFIIWAALMLGGVVAIIESFWVWHGNGKLYPEFRSVGHVNHSSMYTLVVLATGLGALHITHKLFQVLGLVAIIATLAFLPPSRSIIGGGAVVALLVVSAGSIALRKWGFRGLVGSTVAAVLLVSLVLMTPPSRGFRVEFVALVTGEEIFSGRDKILNSVLAVWDEHPIFGTGWFSFGAATSESAVRSALDVEGIEYDASTFWHMPHGHNLWTTMLIERGLVGVVLVTILLYLYVRFFLPIVLSRENLDPLDRGLAVGSLLVAVGFAVAGLGNTTMMNEHGHAGMAFIAVAYGYLRGRGVSSPVAAKHTIGDH